MIVLLCLALVAGDGVPTVANTVAPTVANTVAPTVADADAAQLAGLRRDFHLLGPSEVARRLEPLARADRAGDSADQARLWLGDLALARGATADARRWYQFALQHARDPSEVGRAHRGLGDAAMVDGHPREALREIDLALASHPSPTLQLELEDKQVAARQAARLSAIDLVAWAFLIVFLVAALIQLRRARTSMRAHIPIEIWFLLPVYLLFFGVAFGRGEELARAVVETVLGAFIVISLAAVVPLARRTLPQLMQLTATVVANLAVLYLAVRHAHLMDRLLQSG